MSLRYQPVTMPFGTTQDESGHPFSLPSPLLQSLKNARAYKTGHVKKRPGWTQLYNTGSGSPTVHCANDQLFVVEPNTATNFAPLQLKMLNAANARADSVAGPGGTRSLPEIQVLGRETIWRDKGADGYVASGIGTFSTFPDHGLDPTSGVEVIAWAGRENQSNRFVIFAMAVDAVSRQTISAPRIISSPTTFNSTKPRVVNKTGHLYVLYEHATATVAELRKVPFDCSAMTWGTDSLITTMTAAPVWDACNYANGGEGTGFFIACNDTTPELNLFLFDGSAVVSIITLAVTPTVSLAVYADFSQDRAWVTWNDGTNLKAACRQASSLTTVKIAPMTIDTPGDDVVQQTMTALTSTKNIIVWTVAGHNTLVSATYGRQITKYVTLSGAGTLGTICKRDSFELSSKVFMSAGFGVYASVLYDGSGEDENTPYGARSVSQPTAFTMRITHRDEASSGVPEWSWRAAATWAVGAAGKSRRSGNLSSVQLTATDSVSGDVEYRFMLSSAVETAAATFQAGVAASIASTSGVDLCRMSLNAINNVWQYTAALGRNVVFAGAVPHVFDGKMLTEYGFLVPPDNITGTVVPASGFLSAGDYAVSMIWEYMLASGDVVRSAPVPALLGTTLSPTFTALATGSISLKLPALSLTNKFNDLSGQSATMGLIAKAYRTEANGGVLRYENDDATTFGVTFNAPFLSASNMTLAVGISDANILSHEQLYTNPNVNGGANILPNYPLPAICHIVNHQNRIYGISAEDRRTIVFTHTYDPGELPGWHPDLVVQIDDEAVALVSMDDKLVILAKNGVYLLAGTGPDRSGANSDFRGPVRLNAPHGCVTARSVVQFPTGIIYQAPTGFVAMDRGFNMTRIGGPVEDTLALSPTVICSGTWPSREWAYWSLQPTLTSGGSYVTVCYDWRHNVWSVDNYTQNSEAGVQAAPLTSLALKNDVLFGTLQPNDAVYSHTGFADIGSWITTYMKTAWINLGSSQAFQRCRWVGLLGQREGDHGLQITLSQDYGATSETFTWTALQIRNAPYEHLKHHVYNQRCTSIQVEITDLVDQAVPPYTAGSSYVGLVFDMGFKANVAKLPQSAME